MVMMLQRVSLLRTGFVPRFGVLEHPGPLEDDSR